MMTRNIAWIVGFATLATAQTATEIRLNVEPSDKRLAPGQTATVQVVVIGTGSGDRTGRIRRDDWAATASAGCLSKPFRYQGKDTVEYLDAPSSSFGRLVRQGLTQYTVKDAILFTAPATPGTIKLEFSLDNLRAETTIEVSSENSSLAPAEKVHFAPETPKRDPYRRLAEHYAPFIAQETWFTPKADFLARFDYDGDWRGENNWENLDAGSSQAYVYYAAMETSTHVFLIYNFFHPRDYSDTCILGSCHENDNEGIVVTVQKDGSEFGRLQAVETLAHNNVYSYVNDASLRPGVHAIEGPVAFWKDSHPMVFLESGGHGAYSAGDSRSTFDVKTMRFAASGVTYIYKGSAEQPKGACDTEVGYELLPIYDEWWLRSHTETPEASAFDEYFEYAPFGGRPRMKFARISGAFLGRAEATNKARPFWGWFDMKARKAGAINTGQWALDPAYSLSRNLLLPPAQQFSLDYIFNPYLDIVSEGPRASMQAPPQFVAATPMSSGAVSSGASAAAAPEAGLRGAASAALGQVLTGENRGKLTDIFRRAGVGRGGQDGLNAAADVLGVRTAPASPASPPAVSGVCTLDVTTAGPVDVVLQGNTVSVPDAKLTCDQPLPAASVRIRTELKVGPTDPKVLELPSEANQYAVKLRLSAAASWSIVVYWTK